MCARLQQIGTVARTIEGDFALFAAALRANAPVNSGTEAFFLTNFTDGATQPVGLLSALWHPRGGSMQFEATGLRFQIAGRANQRAVPQTGNPNSPFRSPFGRIPGLFRRAEVGKAL